MIQTAEQALSFIHSCNKFGGKKDDLARMRTLLKTLGSPERLYPVVYRLNLPARLAEDRVAILDYIEFCH